MDPGRRRIEERECQYLAVGDRYLNHHGQEFEIKEFSTDGDGLLHFVTVTNERVRFMCHAPDEVVRARTSVDHRG